MTLTPEDFRPGPNESPAPRSAGFDATRPFLFDGLTPRYATRLIRSRFVPMRDGTRLSTDFLVPLGATLPLPVVLVRTPYGKQQSWVALPTILAEQGFVYAVQDVRGRHESEGVFEPCSAVDRTDGVDTLDWLVKQPWCSGSIGTIGSSYSAETAAKLTGMRHPNHRCGVIMFDGSYAGGNSRNGAFLQGGVTTLKLLFHWFREYVPGVSYGPPPHVDRQQWFAQPYADAYATQPVKLPPVDVDAHLKTLPVCSLVDRSGAPPSGFHEMLRRSANPADPYWKSQGFLSDDDKFATPTLHMTGPLERGGTSFDNFRLMRANGVTVDAREHQYLLFTPERHSRYNQCEEHARFGDRMLGDTRFPYYRMLVDWFSRWLRDEHVDLQRWQKVRYYCLNRNAWHTADTWPPADVRVLRLYLRSGGDANTAAGDGRLDLDTPAVHEPPDAFVYDPAEPMPSEPPSTTVDLMGGGWADRATLEARADMLVYTSAPLEEPWELAGPASVELYVSSSAVDTDFSAVLTEVDRDGRSVNITHGIVRMRYREGMDRPSLMEPGTVYRATIDLWHVAIEIPAGHRIRLEITSSHFPVFDRNLNTGGDNYTGETWRVARNRVHHGVSHPSALLLPMRCTKPRT